MVKILFILSTCFISLSAATYNFEVQSQFGSPKKALHIEIGHQFKALKDTTLNIGNQRVKILRGTIGQRLQSNEIFLAMGSLTFLQKKIEDTRFSFKVRFLRGEYFPQQESTIIITKNNEVRLYEKVSDNFIYIDSQKFKTNKEQLFIGSLDHYYVLAPKNGLFNNDQISHQYLQLLLRNSRIVFDSSPDLSTRTIEVQNFVNINRSSEREHFQNQARRHHK